MKQRKALVILLSSLFSLSSCMTVHLAKKDVQFLQQTRQKCVEAIKACQGTRTFIETEKEMLTLKNDLKAFLKEGTVVKNSLKRELMEFRRFFKEVKKV